MRMRLYSTITYAMLLLVMVQQVVASPILLWEGFDASAHCAPGDGTCLAGVEQLFRVYGIRVQGAWESWEVSSALQTARDIAFRFGDGDIALGQAITRDVFGAADTTLNRVDRDYTLAGEDHAFAFGARVEIPNHWLMEYDLDGRKFMYAHELAHVLDAAGTPLGGLFGGRHSGVMMPAVGAHADCWLVALCSETGRYDPGDEAPITEYAAKSPNEDWANAFAAWIYSYPMGDRRSAFVAHVVTTYRQAWQAE